MSKRYTLAEIDALRSVVTDRLAQGHGLSYSCTPGGMIPTPETNALLARVEDQLRTYMAAGVKAKDFDQ